MPVGLSTTNLANNLLDTLRGVSFSNGAVWAAIHTGDPGASGVTAASAGSTSRVQLTLGSASGGAISLSGAQPYWTNSGTTETITHVSLWSAQTAGSFLFSVALGSSRSWVANDILALSALTISIAPLAS